MNIRNFTLLLVLIFSTICFAGPGGGPPNPAANPPGPPGVPVGYNILVIFIIVLISIFMFKKTNHKLLK